MSDWVALLALGALLLWFLTVSRAHPLDQPLTQTAVIVTLFALAGWFVRGVSLSGAVAGAAVAFTLYATGGPRLFLALIFVFVITLAATRAGNRRKQELHSVEPARGRTARQIAANLLVAAFLCAAYSVNHIGLLLAAALAALAEAAADTVSSEIGVATGGKTYLVTNWRRVTAGADGGVSMAGSMAGVGSALMVSLCAFALKLLPGGSVMPVVIAAVIGMFVDSLLGATLENKGHLNNDAVNLLGTAAAAMAAAGFVSF